MYIIHDENDSVIFFYVTNWKINKKKPLAIMHNDNASLILLFWVTNESFIKYLDIMHDDNDSITLLFLVTNGNNIKPWDMT